MIPKVIHYCWFGEKEKPKLAQKCIKSWKKICDDYEIIEWNETNFDFKKYPYAEYCLREKKWAFLSDFVRLVVIYENGGLYFDTDVEVIRKPDELLKYNGFFGFEHNEAVATGLGFGSEAYSPIVKAMIEEYTELKPSYDGSYPTIVCPRLNTNALLRFGLKLNGERQNLEGTEILPVEFLNPYDDPTGILRKTDNTISIHWYGKSWMSKKSIVRSTLTKPFHRIFGVNCFKWLKRK